MKITDVRHWREDVPLLRPYTIAFATRDTVELVYLRWETDTGLVALGSAAPVPDITGESVDDCIAALDRHHEAFLGHDPRHLGSLCRRAERTLGATPAARAAIDIAAHDLLGQVLGVPTVDVLGRCHDALPTSITIGIKSTDEAIEEAREYLDRGFRHLKVKTGHDLDADIARLRSLRAAVGPDVTVRIDGNQGYDLEATRRLEPLARELDLELIEQPQRHGDEAAMRRLPASLRRQIAADESVQSPADAVALAAACEDGEPTCGILNIKLMKCGGISAARAIASTAEAAGLHLMWGCMDESAISIAAALHAAFASPATRYLDLDGSFDLAKDPARGGFTVEEGIMRPLDQPGLGVRLDA